jgi:hypothetical protein
MLATSTRFLVPAATLVAGAAAADETKVFQLPEGAGPHDAAPAPDGRIRYSAQGAGAPGIRLEQLVGSGPRRPGQRGQVICGRAPFGRPSACSQQRTRCGTSGVPASVSGGASLAHRYMADGQRG